MDKPFGDQPMLHAFGSHDVIAMLKDATVLEYAEEK
jgi:hypothetical protein